jgi:hypothetical protein
VYKQVAHWLQSKARDLDESIKEVPLALDRRSIARQTTCKPKTIFRIKLQGLINSLIDYQKLPKSIKKMRISNL